MADGLDLGKKVGPLPLGVWGIVILGGLGVGFLINRNQQAEPPPAAGIDDEVGRGGGQLIESPPQEIPGELPDELTDNAAWGRRAVNYLISLNNDPVVADNAVRKYLDGQSLNVQETALIALILVRFGAPPEPIAPVEEPTVEVVKQPGITLTKAPSTIRAGAPIQFFGQTTLDGQVAYAGPIYIYLLREDGEWRQHAMDGGGGFNQMWSTTLAPGSKGQIKQFRFEVRQPLFAQPGNERMKIARIHHTVRIV